MLHCDTVCNTYLASPGWANESNDLAGFDSDADVIEDDAIGP
jgi:hypothetical protein